MSSPAPILLIANFANRVGGGEESLLTLIGGLNQHRFVPQAIVPEEGEISCALHKIGVRTTALSLPPVRPWTLIRVLRSLLRLRELIRRCGITLVHAHGNRGALYANLAVLYLHVPVVWHARVVDRDPWLDRILLRLSSAVVANSQATAGRFAAQPRAGEKVHVIYNGVDLDRFRPGPADTELRQAYGLRPDGPVITFAGRLEYTKGPDLFLEAAMHVHKQLPWVNFLFAGDGPMRAELEARVKAAGIPVAFVGHQSNMESLLRLCTVAVMPSRQEAFGRILIEAMATGIPVIATKVGGIPEVCQDGRTALLVPPEDSQALAGAIMASLTDIEGVRLRVSAAAEDVRRRFTLESHVELVCQLYAHILSKRQKHVGNG